MSYNNKTPASVLNAPSVRYEVVEGTEFTGSNRASLRKAGHYSRWLGKSMSSRTRTKVR
jgi:hypothetical protein